MSTWNHRVFKETTNGQDYYTIREAYYDDQGNLESYTSEPSHPGGVTSEELKADLANMLGAFASPILNATDTAALGFKWK